MPVDEDVRGHAGFQRIACACRYSRLPEAHCAGIPIVKSLNDILDLHDLTIVSLLCTVQAEQDHAAYKIGKLHLHLRD